MCRSGGRSGLRSRLGGRLCRIAPRAAGNRFLQLVSRRWSACETHRLVSCMPALGASRSAHQAHGTDRPPHLPPPFPLRLTPSARLTSNLTREDACDLLTLLDFGLTDGGSGAPPRCDNPSVGPPDVVSPGRRAAPSRCWRQPAACIAVVGFTAAQRVLGAPACRAYASSLSLPSPAASTLWRAGPAPGPPPAAPRL